MINRLIITSIDDYFLPLSKRNNNGVYFCRIDKWNEKIEEFIEKYIEASSKCGICIDKKIENPNQNQLDYYYQIIGREFKLEYQYIYKSIVNWLPRLSTDCKELLANSIQKVLEEYRNNNKNMNVIYNAFIKFMCWLYYKFEGVLQQVGTENVPKIVYVGNISEHELKMIYILSAAGTDVLLLENMGDTSYLQIDKNSVISQHYECEGKKIPDEFSIETIREKLNHKVSTPNIPTVIMKKVMNTNTWLSTEILNDALKNQNERGIDHRYYYNLFVGIWGVEDKNNYFNDLLKWKMKIESKNRKVHIIENGIIPPNNDEIVKIKRMDYFNEQHVITEMIGQIAIENLEIREFAQRAFSEVMLEEKENRLQRFLNRSIVMICWMNRYLPKLFKKDINEELDTLVFYGEFKNYNEICFLRMLSRMPIDIVIINPDLKKIDEVKDRTFFDRKYDYSLDKNKFPIQLEQVNFNTVAYNAEQDLNEILYQDTGVYRNQQFEKAIPVTLQTTYEEIAILWNEEAMYRPNFEILADRVMVPVIFSKVSGVPNNNVEQYWSCFAKFIDNDVFFISSLPYIESDFNNPFKNKAHEFIKNGKILAEKIKKSTLYRYSFIRDEMQNYMIDKMQQIIDGKMIQGIYTNGTEYTIVSTLLNMDMQILRMIQKYDFTKQIPKVVVLHTDERSGTLEDSILITYLNSLGFDIVIFVPTGYTSVERFMENKVMLEHQVGEYIYDLSVPDIKKLKRKNESLTDKLFRRGR